MCESQTSWSHQLGVVSPRKGEAGELGQVTGAPEKKLLVIMPEISKEESV